MVLGVGRGDNRKKYIFTYVYIEKKKYSPEPAGQFQSNWYKLSLGKGNFKLFK
jgi:hypothetical protein